MQSLIRWRLIQHHNKQHRVLNYMNVTILDGGMGQEITKRAGETTSLWSVKSLLENPSGPHSSTDLTRASLIKGRFSSWPECAVIVFTFNVGQYDYITDLSMPLWVRPLKSESAQEVALKTQHLWRSFGCCARITWGSFPRSKKAVMHQQH